MAGSDLPEWHYHGEFNAGSEVVLVSMPGGPDPFTHTKTGQSYFYLTKMASHKDTPFSVAVCFEKKADIPMFWKLYDKALTKYAAPPNKFLVALTMSDGSIGNVQVQEIAHIETHCEGMVIDEIEQPNLTHLTKMSMTIPEFEDWIRLGLKEDQLGLPVPDSGRVPTMEEAQLRWGLLSAFAVAVQNDQPESGPEHMISCSYSEQTAGLLHDGTAVQWGPSSEGQRENFPEGKKFRAVSCGGWHTVGLLRDGTAVQWGPSSQGQRENFPEGKKFRAVSCGGEHTVGLLHDGTAVQWGPSSQGERENFPEGKKFRAVSCGGGHTVGLLHDGTAVQWGLSSEGQRENFPEGKKFAS